MKKKLTILIVVFALISCVTMSYSIWLGDVKKDKTFTIESTNDFLFVSSQDAEIVSDDPVLTPTNSVKHSFKIKYKGKAATLKLEVDKIEVSTNGGTAYRAVAPTMVGVILDRTSVDLVQSNTYDYVTCLSEIKFLQKAEDLDPSYQNAKFRYTIKVALAEGGVNEI